jgi:hypothetical protein
MMNTQDGSPAMAKKRAKKLESLESKKTAKPVRLDLSQSDHERLESCARAIGLNKSSYARMAVLERIKADEGRD